MLLLLACVTTPDPGDAYPPDRDRPVPELRVIAALEPGGPVHTVVVVDGAIASVTPGELEVLAHETVRAEWISPGMVDHHAHPGGLGRMLSRRLCGGPLREWNRRRLCRAGRTGR